MKIDKELPIIEEKNLNLQKYQIIYIKDIIRDIFDKFVRRIFYKYKYRNFFKKQNYNIDLVLPSKGFSSLSRKKKLNSIKLIKNKKILIVGCGNGLDIINWLKFKPKYIEAIDLFDYSRSWQKIEKYLKKDKSNTKIKFYQKNILELNSYNKFDFIVSDAVFEHLEKLDEAIKKLTILLKKDGVIYASYGPLWYCFGGDHFSGRDKKENGYNHIILSKKKYKIYFNKNVNSPENEIKHHGSAGIFVKKKLFSKKNANEYF